ncbi:transposase is4 family protein : Transposase family protein OS=Singulisphaera acidiphila (strain ATCC BAA-1392 / DSM 18658 / VKM B-2454 / MOB10) GN=Sinac_0453 PE=4 SV=1: DDE_Tnp_1 [Gemmata massiliana]|uniref:Transposase IS701-like DDE domain-containing protein n=1 Tax=Gemmata massiliana TaxID=1210884 RepID=A0A6P2CS05_9BACT|nr:transposase [Gemmata massiliana]VTR91711.1 transposase is4 family protein : Transposase family protein OS=Singulisphaera acidiphila (strain ATCC BAA-1392 / DSM 18658 / VKM B-2454 / MOB10) GN=Sinac_0453 PE=4 SV=1: DDE_Tnp_1 [Gemmata massiliana]
MRFYDRFMSVPKVFPSDYIDFLIASPKTYSGAEAARVQPAATDPPAHDAFTRLLTRLEPDPGTLWTEAEPQVRRTDGVLVVDDSTLDKPYARAIELVTRHWSGKHRAVVQGINLVSLLWTDGDRHIPCDYRIYDTADGRTKNDHFGDMIRAAYARGLKPRCVVFDGWYGSLDNLTLIRNCGWTWLTRLKSNRLVNKDRQGTRALKDTALAATGTQVWLPGFGLVTVFGIATPDGGTVYWATNDRSMTDLTRLQLAQFSWAIEHYHRGIKQCTGVERCQCRKARAQRNHIGLALRAFLRFEAHCFARGVRWVEAKTAIIRDAVRSYLARPHITFPIARTA